MIEPNRLTDPAERAARERVEVVFAAVDQIQLERGSGLVISARDPDERDRLLMTLEAVAAARGRSELLEDARDAVRNALLARTGWVLMGGETSVVGSRVEDRVAVVAAIDDAVSVAVTEDVLEPDVAAALAAPGRALLGLPPVGSEGDEQLANRNASRQSWEPAEADWAEAQQPTAPGDALLPGVRGLWQLFLGAIAVIGIPATIALGAASDQLWFGILGAVAIGAVCWTLATFRRAT